MAGDECGELDILAFIVVLDVAWSILILICDTMPGSPDMSLMRLFDTTSHAVATPFFTCIYLIEGTLKSTLPGAWFGKWAHA